MSPAQVGSNAGIVGMTKEHLGLALALNVPVFVVVTKIDMCPANILQGKVSLVSVESVHMFTCRSKSPVKKTVIAGKKNQLNTKVTALRTKATACQ